MRFDHLLLSVLVCSGSAWNAEFEGFHHMYNWAGNLHDIETDVKLPSGGQLPLNIAQDICVSDSECTTFGGGLSYFRTLASNSSRDIYLANESAIVPAAICRGAQASCNSPGTKWMFCENDCFGGYCGLQDAVIADFALPPDLLYKTCVQNPACIGFSVDNSGAGGTLFKKSSAAQGWFIV